jgi:hypothetical protein
MPPDTPSFRIKIALAAVITPSFRIKTALAVVIALSAILAATYASMYNWRNFSTAGSTPSLPQEELYPLHQELYHLF